MDTVAEMLLKNLNRDHSESVLALSLQPPMRRRFAGGHRLNTAPTGNGHANPAAFNADRLLNRFWDYPRYLKSRAKEFDLFHIVDHSYSQLAHCLPPERAVITCHDLDTFSCLLGPARSHRSYLFKLMTKRILAGFGKAARVICVSDATRSELLEQGLLSPDRVVVIPNGVDTAFSSKPDPESDIEVMNYLGPDCATNLDILHVGSTIPRKRIDVLLNVFASIKKEFPNARLIRAGGELTLTQQALAQRLGVNDSIVSLPFLSRKLLSAVYRRAALLMQPSEKEGFGLPVVEAMACGIPVLASDLPSLKEVGQSAAVYCPVADVNQWNERAIELLYERTERSDKWDMRRAACLTQASKFSWAESTRRIVTIYKELL